MKHFLYLNKNVFFLFLLICCLYAIPSAKAQTDPAKPNILLIIADDLGVDASNGYQNSAILPNTPHLDSLRGAGVTFMNAWAAPKCTPTRATIMSGKYGVKTGVTNTPGNLDASHTSIFSALSTQTSNAYADAVIGKWHLSQPVDYNHPSQLGIDYYAGSFGSQVADYSNWVKVHNDGTTSMETTYATTDITDEAINWVNTQNQPWFLWLAHMAPHSPFHIPPEELYTSTQTNNNQRKYMTMIEAMDYEIGRLLDNVPSAVLANTIIIFIGDNGTPNGALQNYPSGHGKSSVYQGGAHVPLIISGAGVSRQNEQENALVHATDLYATILELTGGDLAGGVNNSHSFKHLLSGTTGSKRANNYTELGDDWAIRDEQYKLIEFADGSQEFYDLVADELETTNIIASLTSAQATIKSELAAEAATIRSSWSCQDSIQNGDETGIDCGGTYCIGCDGSPAPTYCTVDSLIMTNEISNDTSIYAESYIELNQPLSGENGILQAGNGIVLKPGFEYSPTTGSLSLSIVACNQLGIADASCPNSNTTSYSNIGCPETPAITGTYSETVSGDVRTITSNNFPNHKYGQNSPSQAPSPVNYTFTLDATPTLASTISPVVASNGRPDLDFGVALNGVIFAPAPATPFIFVNTSTGEYNWDWVFEPTNNQGTGMDKVGLDCSSAHTGPQGYHYHGNPFQYIEEVVQTNLSTATTPPAAPVQIGWAADGFPVLYRFGPGENGDMKELKPSYQFKYGNRPGDGISAPCGSYNGKYTNDYEYVASTGDLDECNGVTRTITLTTAQGTETFSYFYLITADFPQVPRCLKGTPSVDFDNFSEGFLEEFLTINTDSADKPIAEMMNLKTRKEPTIPFDLDLLVMPNPTRNKVFISYNGQKETNYQLAIYNYQGQKLQQTLIEETSTTERINASFDMGEYPTGIYFLKLNTGGNIITRKIIKE